MYDISIVKKMGVKKFAPIFYISLFNNQFVNAI